MSPVPLEETPNAGLAKEIMFFCRQKHWSKEKTRQRSQFKKLNLQKPRGQRGFIIFIKQYKIKYLTLMEYANNPKANFDYEILETLEAGIVLKGYEVKSIKTGKVSIKGSYVKILNDEPFLIGATISPYQTANTPDNYDPQESKKLLISKKQISVLVGTSQAHGLTLVPLKLYDKKGRIKLLIGIARGKKKYDKRETIKKKDIARSKQRGLEDL